MADRQGSGGGAPGLLGRNAVVQVAAGQGVGRPQPGQVTLAAEFAAVGPGAGSEVDDVVGDADCLWFVLHHQHRVALVAQLQQHLVHAVHVGGVQAGGGLVEHIGDIGQWRADVADELDAL